ncbi:linoleate diol synthase [Flagelloscypha sp. PMI_526]|nr:linoleate diol synthase [Flagelloscypha sp. PMI_526]
MPAIKRSSFRARSFSVSTETSTSDAPEKMTDSNTGETAVLKQFRDFIKKKVAFVPDITSLGSVVDALTHSDAIDDRKFLLEHVLTFQSQLPDSEFSRALGSKTVQLLYNDLTHPPATIIGDKFKFRTADGSYNNIDAPEIGRAGTPYSRSVQQSTAPKKNELPDPGLIFDTLLRRDGFKEHPAGLSSLMFAFAALVIHSVFRTRHENVIYNDTSSYVDLAPLYGSSQVEQNAIRNKNLGLGYLYPDTFAESRLMLLPPATSILLILFNRNHNFICDKLLAINERGNWTDPANFKSETEKLAQDEEIFQTARLINCGWFGTVVFSDYFSAILGLVRQGSSWSLNPFGEIRKQDHSTFERGKGNSCSVEFNLLYRWHTTTSEADEVWTTKLTEKIFGSDKKPEDITRNDFKIAFAKMHSADNDVQHWSLGAIQRGQDSKFPDAQLAEVLQNATERPAGSFGARHTPAVMRPHEVMGMEQAREWGVCTMNDFRRFLGLKPFESFLEWNSNPEVADAAEKLYGGDIEQLELYPGLQAEETKPMMEGAGLCPGYTVSRAILSDAIALTRGDRHFTYDFTPANLTSWGFADCQRDPGAHGFGSTLARLFLRTLPNHYNERSIYTFFPLMQPVKMAGFLKDLGELEKYDVKRPSEQKEDIVIKDHAVISQILKSSAFKAPFADKAGKVIRGSGFFTVESQEAQSKVAKAISHPEIVENITKYFFDKTSELVETNSYTLVGGHRRAVDIVRDVLTVVPVYFAAEELAGISLKTKGNPSGVYTPKELFTKLSDIFSYIFLDVEAAKVAVLEQRVHGHVHELLGHIKSHLNVTLFQKLSFSGIVNTISSIFKSKSHEKEHHVLVEKLYQIHQSTDETANNILALMVGLSIELSLALTNIFNVYLGSEYEAQFKAAAQAPGTSPFDKFIWEALRLDSPFRSVRRVALQDQTVGSLSVRKGDTVFLDIASAHRDESVFPHADKIDLARPSSGHVKSDSVLVWIGEDISLKVINEVLLAVLSNESVRRGPGASGQLQRFVDSSRKDLNYAYLDEKHDSSPWPVSMVVQYDVKQ